MRLKSGFVKAIKCHLQQSFNKYKNQSSSDLKRYRSEIKRKKSNLEGLEIKFIEDMISESIYIRHRDRIEKDIYTLEECIKDSELTVSNFQEVLDYGLKIAQNLPYLWNKDSLEVKSRLENLLFPEGIEFGKNLCEYRTLKVNPFF